MKSIFFTVDNPTKPMGPNEAERQIILERLERMGIKARLRRTSLSDLPMVEAQVGGVYDELILRQIAFNEYANKVVYSATPKEIREEWPGGHSVRIDLSQAGTA